MLDILAHHHIDYLRVDHPPVFTCEEAAQHVPAIVGAETKNLFLRDEKRSRYFLLGLPAHKSADLKLLAPLLGAKRLTLASADELQQMLGVSPGSVTLLATCNDVEKRVQVVVDSELWESERVLCHPLVNTTTLSILRDDLARFFALTGHALQVLNVPARGLA